LLRAGLLPFPCARLLVKSGCRRLPFTITFPNKQALLADLMRAHMEDLLAAWDAEQRTSEMPEAALERFARFHIRFHAGRSDAVFISYMELRSLEPDNFRHVEKQRQQYESALRSILDAGVARGVFSLADTRVAAMAIIAMLTGVISPIPSRSKRSAASRPPSG
jgi:AcrR family transcriptional regulator